MRRIFFYLFLFQIIRTFFSILKYVLSFTLLLIHNKNHFRLILLFILKSHTLLYNLNFSSSTCCISFSLLAVFCPSPSSLNTIFRYFSCFLLPHLTFDITVSFFIRNSSMYSFHSLPVSKFIVYTFIIFGGKDVRIFYGLFIFTPDLYS